MSADRESPPEPTPDAGTPSGHCDRCGVNCQDCTVDALRAERDALRRVLSMCEGYLEGAEILNVNGASTVLAEVREVLNAK